ncbi:MAG: hypothetical protein ABI851_02300 [Saprospiraceae bacterium]
MTKFIKLFFLLFSIPLFSQNNLGEQQITVVYLKNGSVLKGYLAKGNIENSFELKLMEGITMQLPFSEVKKMVQPTERFRKPYEYLFREKGIYNISSLKLNSGISIDNQFSLGFGIESVTGYMLNRYFGLGLGLGYDYYGTESFNALYPVFLEARGYLFGERNAYYYSLAGGYSFAASDSELKIRSGHNSWMWHPAIGVRIGAKQNFNFTIDFGLRFQNASWVYEPSDSFIKSEEYRYLYKRFIIRFGFQI